MTLKAAIDLLYEVKEKWYDIGIQLDIDVKILDKIRSEYKDDVASCLREILTVWLLRENPSWGELAEALKAKTVNKIELAEEGKMACFFCWKLNLHNFSYINY